MEKPLLSVIMPVYNSAEYIETAVKSVLDQTFSALELICIDDCSKDNSLEILKKTAEKDADPAHGSRLRGGAHRGKPAPSRHGNEKKEGPALTGLARQRTF